MYSPFPLVGPWIGGGAPSVVAMDWSRGGIEAWIYGQTGPDSAQRWDAGNLIRIRKNGDPNYSWLRLPQPMVFTDSLEWWQTKIAATAGVLGANIAVTSGQIHITGTDHMDAIIGAGFTPSTGIDDGTVANVLELPIAGAHSLAIDGYNLLGISVTAPQDARSVDAQTYRHGRAIAAVYGAHQTRNVRALIRADRLPPNMAYLTTGAIRVHQTDNTMPYTVNNLDGYIDGYVIESKPLQTDGSIVTLDLTLAVPQ